MNRVVIIEDEVNSQELLKAILEERYQGFSVLGVADSVSSGVSIIQEHQPDVVFLDVEIQGGTGFDVLNALDQVSFKVIFVTGYDHYALKAIKYSALDYILKPINFDELDQAIAKIGSSEDGQSGNLNFLRQFIQKTPEEIDEIVVSDDKGYNVIKFDDVLYIKADGTYVTFFMQDNIKHVVTYTLQHYESILPSSQFFRIHKSYLVNLNKVIGVDSGRGGTLTVKDGDKLPIAYRRKAGLVKQIKDARMS